MERTSLDDEIRRGEQADLLLQNPILIESFDKIEEELTEAWISSPQRDVDARERLHLSICLLRKLKEQIREVAETGKLARHQSMLQQAKEKTGKLFGIG